MAPAADTGTRLGSALLAYLLSVTLIVTLLPFQFAWPAKWQIIILLDPVDFVANILLFVPLGFLYRLTGPKRRSYALGVLALGALLSTAIELAQLFEGSRNTSVVDVATNAFGAWLGALAFDRIARWARLDGRVIGWLSLELPLMCLVYLLVPLLWINSVAVGGDALRLALTILTGLFGAHFLGGIQRHFFGPAGLSEPRQTATFAGWQGCRAASQTEANRRF